MSADKPMSRRERMHQWFAACQQARAGDLAAAERSGTVTQALALG